MEALWNIFMGVSILFGIDPRVLLTIAAIESDFNPDAINPISGATGIMQVMPCEAGEAFRDRPPQHELLRPEINVYWGAKILTEYLERYGDMGRALSAYFAGPSYVEKHGLHPDYLARYRSTWDVLFRNPATETGAPQS